MLKDVYYELKYREIDKYIIIVKKKINVLNVNQIYQNFIGCTTLLDESVILWTRAVSGREWVRARHHERRAQRLRLRRQLCASPPEPYPAAPAGRCRCRITQGSQDPGTTGRLEALGSTRRGRAGNNQLDCEVGSRRKCLQAARKA